MEVEKEVLHLKLGILMKKRKLVLMHFIVSILEENIMNKAKCR